MAQRKLMFSQILTVPQIITFLNKIDPVCAEETFELNFTEKLTLRDVGEGPKQRFLQDLLCNKFKNLEKVTASRAFYN